MPTHGHYQHVAAIGFTRAGDVVSAGEDGTVRWWNSDGTSAAMLGELEGLKDLAVIDEEVIVAGHTRLARISAERRVVWRSEPTPRPNIHSFTRSSDQRWIATGDEGFLRVWESSSGACRFELEIGRQVRSVGYSADGTRLFALDLEGRLTTLATDWSSVDEVTVGRSFGWEAGWATTRSLMLAPGCGARSGGPLKLYDLTGKRSRLLWTATPFKEQSVPQVALGAGGRTALAAIHSDEIVVLDGESGSVLDRLAVTAGSVSALAISPDEESFAVGTSTGALLRFTRSRQ